jgi:hypothetical protein
MHVGYGFFSVTDSPIKSEEGAILRISELATDPVRMNMNEAFVNYVAEEA